VSAAGVTVTVKSKNEEDTNVFDSKPAISHTPETVEQEIIAAKKRAEAIERTGKKMQPAVHVVSKKAVAQPDKTATTTNTSEKTAVPQKTSTEQEVIAQKKKAASLVPKKISRKSLAAASKIVQNVEKKKGFSAKKLAQKAAAMQKFSYSWFGNGKMKAQTNGGMKAAKSLTSPKKFARKAAAMQRFEDSWFGDGKTPASHVKAAKSLVSMAKS